MRQNTYIDQEFNQIIAEIKESFSSRDPNFSSRGIN